MTTDAIAIAVAQFAPTDETSSNLANIRILAEHAVGRGAQLVVFPEFSSFFLPELGARSVAAAEPLDGPFVSALSELAVELGVHLVAGMLETTVDSKRFSNTVVAVDASGAIAATYRKLHLFDAFGHKESDWVVKGAIEQPKTFALGGLTIGIQLCNDVRFPEVTRRIVDAGADVVLLPSEWVRGPMKEHHWSSLITARALENTIYMAAANQSPPVGTGNSMIVDPMGVGLAMIGENVDVALAWVSPSRIAEVRAMNPVLALRRFGTIPLTV